MPRGAVGVRLRTRDRAAGVRRGHEARRHERARARAGAGGGDARVRAGARRGPWRAARRAGGHPARRDGRAAADPGGGDQVLARARHQGPGAGGLGGCLDGRVREGQAAGSTGRRAGRARPDGHRGPRRRGPRRRAFP